MSCLNKSFGLPQIVVTGLSHSWQILIIHEYLLICYMKLYPLISIVCKSIILNILMVHRIIFNRNEENIMAYSLIVKMGAAYVGAIALMTVAATLLA